MCGVDSLEWQVGTVVNVHCSNDDVLAMMDLSLAGIPWPYQPSPRHANIQFKRHNETKICPPTLTNTTNETFAHSGQKPASIMQNYLQKNSVRYIAWSMECILS